MYMGCFSALAMQCGHYLGAMLRICGSYYAKQTAKKSLHNFSELTLWDVQIHSYRIQILVLQNALGGHLPIYDI